MKFLDEIIGVRKSSHDVSEIKFTSRVVNFGFVVLNVENLCTLSVTRGDKWSFIVFLIFVGIPLIAVWGLGLLLIAWAVVLILKSNYYFTFTMNSGQSYLIGPMNKEKAEHIVLQIGDYIDSIQRNSGGPMQVFNVKSGSFEIGTIREVSGGMHVGG